MLDHPGQHLVVDPAARRVGLEQPRRDHDHQAAIGYDHDVLAAEADGLEAVLAVGETRELKVSPPVRVQSTDGAVTVALAGGEARPVGEPGVAGQGTFVAD